MTPWYLFRSLILIHSNILMELAGNRARPALQGEFSCQFQHVADNRIRHRLKGTPNTVILTLYRTHGNTLREVFLERDEDGHNGDRRQRRTGHNETKSLAISPP